MKLNARNYRQPPVYLLKLIFCWQLASDVALAKGVPNGTVIHYVSICRLASILIIDPFIARD